MGLGLATLPRRPESTHPALGPSDHRAGLDGLRGVAVAAVVAFHLWPGAVPGGFLGVTMFFALSGYLIVGRLATERRDTGTFSPRAFWARRARRLLPAGLLTLAAVTAVWWAAGWLTGDIAGNGLAALFDVANWFEIARRNVYGVHLDSSPFVHFWSLAIEEQAYVIVALLAVVAGRRATLIAGVTLLLMLSVTATVWSAGDATVVYYSTFTRIGEIAAGGLAALVLTRRRAGGTRGPTTMGLIALGLFAWLVLGTSLNTSEYYRGGLLASGLLSAFAVAGVARSPSLDRLLGWRPLAALGRISYAVYLFHWPLIVGLRRLGLDGRVVAAGTISCALALAAASARLLEDPIRRRTIRWRVSTQVVGGLALASVVVVATVLPVTSPAGVGDLQQARAQFHRQLAEVAAPVTSTEPPARSSVAHPGAPAASGAAATVPALPPPLRVGLFGDSKALALGLGLSPPDSPRLRVVAESGQLGCPVGRGGRRRVSSSAMPATPQAACDWSLSWPAELGKDGPIDLAVVYAGSWDVQDRSGAPLGRGWTHIGESAYDEWLLGEMQAASLTLLDGGVETVVWLTVTADPSSQPVARFERYNQLLVLLAGTLGPRVKVVDLAGWIAASGENARLLPDGVHTTWESGGGTVREIGDRFLAAALLDAAGRGEGTRPDGRTPQ